MTKIRTVAILLVVALFGAACGNNDDGDVPTPDGDELSGLLRLTAGQCDDAGVTEGSWFRMLTPEEGATLDDGPYMENGDSPCGDATWTPLSSGTDGGLLLGDYQPEPESNFDDAGHSLADAIIDPQAFFAVRFGVATNPIDPQTGASVPPPTVTVDDDGRVVGDLSAFAASWNRQHFNQGSPKPDGALADQTRPVSGTFDPGSGALVLEWSSLIVGGPFDGFTGVWHLTGTFEVAT